MTSQLGSPAHDAPAFFPMLVERARGLSAAPPRPSGSTEMAPSLRDIPWETYRKITYRPEKALWRGEPGHFEAQFFHMGYGYRDPVSVFVVDGQNASQVRFSSDMFAYDAVQPPTQAESATLGFAGMRLHMNLNKADFRDEFMVFQGASYFRAANRGGWYGLSGRGLAIDTGVGNSEEFPRFSEMYLQHPGPEDKFIWVMALLESKRATGAYAMRIEPGDFTTIEVTAQVFLRDQSGIIGVAPLTSMFLYGEDHPSSFGDYRPEVHDSDGLVMWTKNGEHVFRQLHNPPQRTTATAFRLDSPQGFGLEQRDRSYDHYQDIVEHYHERPSAWIEPLSDWGPGSIRLLEITTRLESDDNIGAMWVPDHIENNQLALKYRVHFGSSLPYQLPVGRVTGTRYASWEPNRGRFVVDFADLPNTPDTAPPRLDVSVSRGRIAEPKLLKNPYTGGYRVEVDVIREGTEDIDIRVALRNDAGPLTETWSYLWQPTH